MDKIFKNIFFWLTLGCILLSGIFALLGAVQRVDSSAVNSLEKAINKRDLKIIYKNLPPEVQSEVDEIPDIDDFDEFQDDETKDIKVKFLQGDKYLNDKGQIIVPVIMIGYDDGECHGTFSVDIPVKKDGLKEYFDVGE